MRKFKLLATLLTVIFIVQMAAVPVLAEWSGALIVTREHPIGHEPLTIYTVALDYAITDWWYADIVIDSHPIQGVDGDVSTTFYLPEVLGKTIYISVGARSGVWHSARPLTVYWSIALKF